MQRSEPCKARAGQLLVLFPWHPVFLRSSSSGKWPLRLLPGTVAVLLVRPRLELVIPQASCRRWFGLLPVPPSKYRRRLDIGTIDLGPWHSALRTRRGLLGESGGSGERAWRSASNWKELRSVTGWARYTGERGTIQAEYDLLLRIGTAGRSGSIDKT